MADRGATVVFAGPSLPRRPDAEWQGLLGRCELRPPARRGDVLAALPLQPRAIVLVDGYYFTMPAVTHKELLYALDAGVRVIGAASLGALRALELAPFGMVGVGEVFARYRSGEIDGDDEVALLHTPAEHGYRPLGVALVEVRHAVDRLAAAGTLAAEDGRQLIAAVKALSFLDRHPDRIAELARRHLGAAAAAELGRRLRADGVKVEDTRRALQAAFEEAPAQPAQRRALGGYLNYYKEACLPCSAADPQSPSLQQAWRMAQLFHPQAVEFVREIRRRSLLVAAAVRAGAEAPAEAVRQRAGELRRLHAETCGAPLLPAPEYEEEARFEILAAADVRPAQLARLAQLAASMGLAGSGEEALIRIVAGGSESIPAWWLARAFSLRPAFPAAVATAAAAGEVHRCFLRWADGARILEEDLRRLAARLWNCPPEAVDREAARRGIFPSSLVSDGLREALELVAAAERLPRPINDYPQRRDALARLSLQAVTPAFAGAPVA